RFVLVDLAASTSPGARRRVVCTDAVGPSVDLAVPSPPTPRAAAADSLAPTCVDLAAMTPPSPSRPPASTSP
ncbi:unnamed protein product, partial [Urochloa humidicola]